ncbi:MAG: hypothetical protein KC503_39540 [Myxococcales bacterium]|nr:hypothetical protein [Myxococcales bacterium]
MSNYGIVHGTHRSVAVIVLVKRGKLTRASIVGKIDDNPLTAGELVDIYDSDRLMILNRNYRGAPWYDLGKVKALLREFELSRFFDPARDGGTGIWICSDRGNVDTTLQETKPLGGPGTIRRFVDLITAMPD